MIKIYQLKLIRPQCSTAKRHILETFFPANLLA